MKIPGFGGGATNANKVDLPPSNNMGKLPDNQPGKTDLPGQPGKQSVPFANNSKMGPLNFASNAFGGLSTLTSLTGLGGSQSNSQANGGHSATNGSNSLLGGGLMQQLMMLLGLQQLLGGGEKQQQIPQQPAQSHTPSTGGHKSSNPLEQLMQMIQQLLAQFMGIGKDKGADEGQGTGNPGGNVPQTPANGATDNAQQSGGGMAGMLKNLMMLMGLSSVLQSLMGGGQGQSSQNNSQI